MTAPTVVGLDLSLTSTGLASVSGADGIDLARYISKGKKGDNLASRQTRISTIVNDIIADLLDWFGDAGDVDLDLVVVESPSYGSQHGSPHDRSGLWWLIVNALHELDVPVATVSPQGRAKYGTGSGRAKKPEVYAAVKEAYPDLRFTCDDEADALLLAAMGSRHLGHPIDPWATKAQLSAMDGAAWPT